MHEVKVDRVIDISADEAWAIIDDFGGIYRFHPLVERFPPWLAARALMDIAQVVYAFLEVFLLRLKAHPLVAAIEGKCRARAIGRHHRQVMRGAREGCGFAALDGVVDAAPSVFHPLDLIERERLQRQFKQAVLRFDGD